LAQSRAARAPASISSKTSRKPIITVPMNRYKHIIFNPHLGGIDAVIASLGENSIWALSNVIPISEFQWVAVFESWDATADEEKEFIKA
jgi:hypothetical protein